MPKFVAKSSEATGLAWEAPASGGGINWTNRKIGVNDSIRKIAYNGTNLYVAVGANGTLFSSPDGKTWTSRTSGFGANGIDDVYFGNGLWVAVGVNGTITTSTDAITWTARTSNMSTNRIRAVYYANSLWVAVGAGGGTTNTGGITYSSDGTTWTRKSQSLTVGAFYQCLIWNGTNWIVGSSHSTNNHLYASDPSGTWTADQTGSENQIFDIFWDGTRHITIEGNAFSFSTSTTLGTTTSYRVGNTSAGVADLQPATLYSNKLYYHNGAFVQAFIPESSADVSFDAPNFAPALLSTSSLSLSVTCIYYDALGYIAATSNGAIFTSY